MKFTFPFFKNSDSNTFTTIHVNEKGLSPKKTTPVFNKNVIRKAFSIFIMVVCLQYF